MPDGPRRPYALCRTSGADRRHGAYAVASLPCGRSAVLSAFAAGPRAQGLGTRYSRGDRHLGRARLLWLAGGWRSVMSLALMVFSAVHQCALLRPSGWLLTASSGLGQTRRRAE